LEYIKRESANIVGQIQGIITQIVGFVFKFFLVLMITAFILVDTKRIKDFFFSLVSIKDKRRFDGFLGRIDTGLSGVVRGQLLICLINALLTFVGLLLLKIKFSFILATLAGIFSLIPIFGSIISTIPIAIVAISTSFTTCLLAVLWIVAIHALEANFLNPKIMGNAAKIHPVVIVLALVIGKHFYGLVGALLAVPIASIFLTIFHSFLQKAKDLEKPVVAK
ncbi:AI-2E family transporter, partial [Sulfobacillus acidophilus]|nr:AI-2E family transporter [Sulfobacillus acidophilus]